MEHEKTNETTVPLVRRKEKMTRIINMKFFCIVDTVYVSRKSLKCR